jgi:hypothetical protein
MLLERALDFEITHSNDFEETLTACVYDRFLGGRGVSWIRYEPVIETIESEATESISEDDIDDSDNEYLDIETTPVDYVHWKDFGHEVARSWDEVTMVWRKVYMTRSMLRDRFPDWADKIPLDSSPDDQKMKQTEGVGKRALIVEIWNKETKKVCWLSISLGKIVDEHEDPLSIEGFWPCPKPLFATMTNETLVPVPDFTLYQDQAGELDVLTDRIQGLINALKVRGVYDASTPELARLFTEGDNNTLIPVKNYSSFSEKGGMNGAVSLVDIRPIAEALGQAYQAMNQVKQQIYDITGISDIIRGASVASETATAQQIKGQYATLRLKTFQDDVAKFASAILKIKAQIICQHFQPETIVKIGGAAQMSPTDQQMIPQAIELLKNNPMRTFRVEVLADSMLLADEQQEKSDRVEFLQATSSFIEKAVQGAQAAPQLTPLLMDLLKFGVTGFRVGRSLEGEFDALADQQKEEQAKKQANPQPPPPNPEAIKAQAEAQKSQTEAQMAQAKMQQEAQLEQVKLQLAQQEATTKAQMEAQRLEFEKWKAQLDNDTKVLIAEMQANKDIKTASLNINSKKVEDTMTMIDENGNQVAHPALTDLVNAINQNLQMMTSSQMQNNEMLLQQQEMAHQQLINNANRPKQVVRDASGKIVGIQ